MRVFCIFPQSLFICLALRHIIQTCRIYLSCARRAIDGRLTAVYRVYQSRLRFAEAGSARWRCLHKCRFPSMRLQEHSRSRMHIRIANGILLYLLRSRYCECECGCECDCDFECACECLREYPRV